MTLQCSEIQGEVSKQQSFHAVHKKQPLQPAGNYTQSNGRVSIVDNGVFQRPSARLELTETLNISGSKY